jgi:hypothetical protein
MVAKRSRFVVPNTVRLALSDDDWCEVKERLTFGERQALASAGLTQTGSMVNDDATVQLNMAGYKIARLAAYLVEWSFRDEDDRTVPVTRATIETLDPATADEIDAALDAHVAATQASPTTPTATSPPP